MGSFFRSERMILCEFIVESDMAYLYVGKLGDLGLLELRDANEGVRHSDRKYVQEVRMCSDLENKLCEVVSALRKDNVTINSDIKDDQIPNWREIMNLQAEVDKLLKDLDEVNQNTNILLNNYIALQEILNVLIRTSDSLKESRIRLTIVPTTIALIEEHEETDTEFNLEDVNVGFTAGTIPYEKANAFEKVLWRICSGNAIADVFDFERDIDDPSGTYTPRKVFLIFTQGDQLRSRVLKVIEGFGGKLYTIPDEIDDRRNMAKSVAIRIREIKKVLDQSKSYREILLAKAADMAKTWLLKVRKCRAIYHALNFFNYDVAKKCLVVEAWVPARSLPELVAAMEEVAEKMGSRYPPIFREIPTTEEPPTLFLTNKFTKGFQVLIDSYGVAAYREVNPALYTIITFPFLFAVMFGDFIHGCVVFAFGLWMVMREKKLGAVKTDNEIWKIFFAGRYIIMLLGAFSMYTGFLYNDFGSQCLNFFGSAWRVNYDRATVASNEFLQLDPKTDVRDTPYYAGIDPIWHVAENEIDMLNSIKMKMSVLLGIAQMTFGLFLNLCNHIHFRDWLSIIFDFLPQIVFLFSLFMYLCFLMVFKWLMYSAKNPYETSPTCAPKVLITFINMIMMNEEEPPGGCPTYMFSFQDTLQKILLALAAVCVPVMLMKPIFQLRKRKDKPIAVGDYKEVLVTVSDIEARMETSKESDEGGAGEVVIHQAIHTIEYVLGSVSHTASYLRLWALSLAHAQLSQVAWRMLLIRSFASNSFAGVPMCVVVFFIWAAISLAILIVMEGLSAFLHCLRLHWVEFQSKFYQGSGKAFEPFDFKKMVEEGKCEI